MTITVWGRASSSNVQAVMWGVAEMGLSADRIDVGGRFGGLDTQDYRDMNPFGLVPVLRDGDGPPLFESAAILRYLANRYGRDPFWPADPVARAQVDMWAHWGKHDFSNAFLLPIFWGHWRTPEADRDIPAIRGAITHFEGLTAMVGTRVAKDGYMMGPDLTLADIWVGHMLFRYFTLDIERSPDPDVAAYYDRLVARPAYREHVMIDYAELKAIS